jgi:hypothetical protein
MPPLLAGAAGADGATGVSGATEAAAAWPVEVAAAPPAPAAAAAASPSKPSTKGTRHANPDGRLAWRGEGAPSSMAAICCCCCCLLLQSPRELLVDCPAGVGLTPVPRLCCRGSIDRLVSQSPLGFGGRGGGGDQGDHHHFDRIPSSFSSWPLGIQTTGGTARASRPMGPPQSHRTMCGELMPMASGCWVWWVRGGFAWTPNDEIECIRDRHGVCVACRRGVVCGTLHLSLEQQEKLQASRAHTRHPYYWYGPPAFLCVFFWGGMLLPFWIDASFEAQHLISIISHSLPFTPKTFNVPRQTRPTESLSSSDPQQHFVLPPPPVVRHARPGLPAPGRWWQAQALQRGAEPGGLDARHRSSLRPGAHDTTLAVAAVQGPSVSSRRILRSVEKPSNQAPLPPPFFITHHNQPNK